MDKTSTPKNEQVTHESVETSKKQWIKPALEVISTDIIQSGTHAGLEGTGTYFANS